jgi:hypothetical protein
MLTSNNLPVSDECKATVKGAAEASLRCVMVGIEGEALVAEATFPESESPEADFKAMQAKLTDDKASILLVRLKGAGAYGDDDWAMISFVPDNAPVKTRMMTASSLKPLKAEFSWPFVQWEITSKDEVTLAQFLSDNKKLSEEERRDAMSREERDMEDVKKEVAKEQASAPKKLAGLVALQVKAQRSFDEGMATLQSEEKVALLGQLCGDKSEELSGEILDDIEKPSDLKGGKLPQDHPVYVIMKKTESRWLLISWQPENAPIKIRMKGSTFKASVLELLKEALPGDAEIVTTECQDEDDLEDDLGEPRKASEGGEAPGAAAAPKTGGYKPPFGGMAMPGMGGPRPMPGAMKMPGM